MNKSHFFNKVALRLHLSNRSILGISFYLSMVLNTHCQTPYESDALNLHKQKGIGFWPTDYSPEYVNRSFEILKQNAGIACVQFTDWNTDRQNNALQTILEEWIIRAKNCAMKTSISFEPFDGSRKNVRIPYNAKNANSISSTKWQSIYCSTVVNIVSRLRPDYCNIGVEANMFYKKNPSQYQYFLQMFDTLYAQIKKICPDTKVFCSYQYEVLAGIFLGHKNAPQAELLGKSFFRGDLVGISSYPLFFTSPYDIEKIPNNYYSILDDKILPPVFFSEVGFYSGSNVNPKSTPQKQADFINGFPPLIKNLHIDAACWISLSDLRDIPSLKALKKQVPHFFSLGLTTATLSPKAALKSWSELEIPVMEQSQNKGINQ